MQAGGGRNSAQPSSTEKGRLWETHAERYLCARGLTPVMRNYRCRLGEIDLVMRDGDSLVMVEVRYRRGSSHGGAAASVTPAKQRRLILAARHYLGRHGGGQYPVRFDVLALAGDLRAPQIDWYRAAFDADG